MISIVLDNCTRYLNLLPEVHILIMYIYMIQEMMKKIIQK